MAIAKLSIDIVAQVASLQRDLNQATGMVQRSAQSMQAAFGLVRGVVVGLAGALGAAGLAAYFDRINAGVLALKDLSEATGASIEDISSLENVARNAGGGIEEVRTTLVKFNAVLKDAERTKEIGTALQAIGVDAQRLRSISPADALLEVAQALEQYQDDGNKARVVQELFGRSIQQAMPFLKELAEQGKVAATVTTEQALAVDTYNKQLAAFRRNVEDGARAITAELMPALNRLADRIRDKGFWAGIFGANETQEAIISANAISARLAVVTQQIVGWQARADAGDRVAIIKIRAYREEYAKLQQMAAKASAELKELGGGDLPQAAYSHEGRNYPRRIVLPPAAAKAAATPKIVAPRPSAPLLDAADLAALRALESTDAARIAELHRALEGLFALQRETRGQAPAVAEAIAATVAQIEQLDPAARAAQESANRLASALGRTEARQAADDARLLASAIEAIGTASDPQRIRELGELIDDLSGFSQKATAEIQAATEEMSTFATRAQERIQDALGDTLVQAMRGNFESIGDLWRGLLQQMVAQALATKLNEVLFGGKGGGGGLLSGIFGSIFGGGRATGGEVNAGMLYRVNENSAEYFAPGVSGRVVPLRPDAAGGGMSVQINQTLHIGQGVSRAEVYAAASQAKAAAQAELVQLMRRTGAMA